MRFFTLLVLFFSSAVQAQPCSGPGRTPQTAFGLCAALTFHQADIPPCTAGDLFQTSCTITAATTSNSVWYKIHCYQSGTLGFLITPASVSDDYDWALMDVTGRAPQDVLTTNLVISLNMCGYTGTTGCNATGTSNVNCEGNTNLVNEMPLLLIDHDYLLMVTNWSNTGLGYDLTFSGTAVITNNLPPIVTSVGIAGCNASLVKIAFSEDILCSSLSANGSEFSIISGTHVINTVSSTCNQGSNTLTDLILTLQAPLPAGNYSLVVNNGSDLNTLLDVCNDIIPAGTSFPFSVPAQVPLAIKNITYSGCAPTILKAVLSTPVLCNSITATGSEFSISPGNPAITLVQSTCSTGSIYTDTLRIVLQNPLPYGNYQLIVNNGTDGNTLTDTCGTQLAAAYQFPLVINQLTSAPVVQSIIFDECKPYRLTINFDKPVKCNSLSLSGSEFSVTPGTLTIADISTNCGANNYFTQAIINLSGNLPAGSFSLHINNGTDGNTLSDTCFVFMPANAIKPFATIQSPAPLYDSLKYEKCSPSEIKIFYSKAIDCGSVFAPGIEFYITGPSVVNIASVSGNPSTCSTSYSNWFILHLSQPISTSGNYILHNRWGPDGNSVSDTCFATQDTTETIAFNVLGRPSAIFADEIKWGCQQDSISLSHAGGNSINSWTWNFSDGTTTSGQNAIHSFPVTTVSATVQLITSNAACRDTLQRSYILNNAFNATFITGADTSCIGSNVSFANNSTGNNLQHQWLFGDNTGFYGQTPPAHVYSTSDSFTILLLVSNDHGCHDTAFKKIFITREPVVDFSGLKAQYCTGEVVTLISALRGNISSYTWNNGGGGIFQNVDTVSYFYNTQADYIISLSATDRFCGVVVKDSSAKVYKVPVFDLGKDKILCPGLVIKIGVTNVPGYSCLWNNSATSSEIVTALQSNTYKLAVNNNGCVAEDEIFVNVLENCLIKVAGAFTPNGDGMNDKLKAINADLATHFLFRIYNRFGQMLFSTTNPLEGWDGRYKGNPLETGTFVWQLSYVDPTTKKTVYQKGASILIR